MSQHPTAQVSRNEAEMRARPVARPEQGRARSLDRDGREILARTVERDVIPLLVALPWMQTRPTPPSGACRVEPSHVDRLVALCLEPDSRGVAMFVAALHDVGVPPESLYTDLLTPVARELGAMWADDRCSFAETTIGVLRLQNAQRALAPQFVGGTVPGVGAPRALLLPVPGEQHTFGLSMVVDFFSRAGWDARSDSVATEAQAIALVKHERADLVGLSFACDERIGTAERLIAAFRSVSPRNLIVMVGGPSFVADPALATRVGADGTAANGHEAALLAHALVHRAAEPAQAGLAGQS